LIQFYINDQPVSEAAVSPTTTLLNYLRRNRGLTGTKEGCAEGDCGACTVAVAGRDPNGEPVYRAVNSCLLLLPSLHGKRIYTVEGLRQKGEYHPVQKALVERLGSQCGYCTPGIVMSMFEACYRDDLDKDWKIDDQLCGNLCRCTGYRPIREAVCEIAGQRPDDGFLKRLAETPERKQGIRYESCGQSFRMPGSLEELWEAMDEEPTARLVCGATDLGLDVTKKHIAFPALISLEAVEDLQGIVRKPGGWSLGAAVPLSELEAALEEGVPVLCRMLRYFGARQIKNRATLGGNLCNASPIGDMAPVLLALGAGVVLASRAGERTVPLDDFFTGYRQTALRTGEVLARVEIPDAPIEALLGAYKVSKRRELDISAVAAGMMVVLDAEGNVAEARLAYGGMAATPKRASHAERFLVGRPWTLETVQQAMAEIDRDFTPLSDQRGSSWYRGEVARNLLLGFFEETRKKNFVPLSPRHSSTIVLEAK
jgi:xanthine dehydrogenase small subunit